MESLPHEYLAEAGRQLAFLSAVLGGFATTFLAQLITSELQHRKAKLCIASTAIAAILFIIATIYATYISISSYPGAPGQGSFMMGLNRLLTTVTFLLGIYSLMVAIGFSGWIRSRRLGIITSIAAAFGALLISFLFFIG